MSRRPWDGDEIAWARACFAAGDTVAEIAEIADRACDDVRRITGSDSQLTPTEREVLSLYAAGLTFAEIDEARGVQHVKPGRAASVMVSTVRLRKRLAIPYRYPVAAA